MRPLPIFITLTHQHLETQVFLASILSAKAIKEVKNQVFRHVKVSHHEKAAVRITSSKGKIKEI
jgi:hypothetical protein